MNYWIIVIPSLLSAALGVGGLAYGAWQGQNAKAEARLQTTKERQALRAENKRLTVQDKLSLCYADGLEQELESMTDACNVYEEERDEARLQRDKLNRENEKLHAQVTLLVETLNDQHATQPLERGHVDEAPLATNNQQHGSPTRSTRKRQAPPATDTASH